MYDINQIDPPADDPYDDREDCMTCGCLECRCYEPMDHRGEQEQAELKQWVEDITADW